MTSISSRLEAAQVAVLDQVVGVAVVLLVADVIADVVQQRALSSHSRSRSPRPCMALVWSNSDSASRATCFDDRLPSCSAPPSSMTSGGGRRDSDRRARCRDGAMDVIEHQAFAQRQIAQRDLFGARCAQQRVEQHGAGDRQIGAPRVEAGQFSRSSRSISTQSCAGGGCSSPAREGCAFAGTLPRSAGHRAEAQDRARRADDAIVAARRCARGSGRLAR